MDPSGAGGAVVIIVIATAWIVGMFLWAAYFHSDELVLAAPLWPFFGPVLLLLVVGSRFGDWVAEKRRL